MLLPCMLQCAHVDKFMVAKPHAEAEAAVTEVDTHSDAVVAEPHAEAAVTDNDTHSEVDFVGEADEKKTEQTKNTKHKKNKKINITLNR